MDVKFTKWKTIHELHEAFEYIKKNPDTPSYIDLKEAIPFIASQISVLKGVMEIHFGPGPEEK